MPNLSWTLKLQQIYPLSSGEQFLTHEVWAWNSKVTYKWKKQVLPEARKNRNATINILSRIYTLLYFRNREFLIWTLKIYPVNSSLPSKMDINKHTQKCSKRGAKKSILWTSYNLLNLITYLFLRLVFSTISNKYTTEICMV